MNVPPIPRNQNKQLLIVWWALWAAFQLGIFTIYHFITGPAPAPPAASALEPGPWLAAILPFAASVLIRFAVLPRMKSGMVALPIFIVGIALAEFTCFLGIFIFRTTSAISFFSARQVSFSSSLLTFPTTSVKTGIAARAKSGRKSETVGVTPNHGAIR